MIVHYSDTFKRQVRRLSRKYRRIRSDIQPLIEQLEAGEPPGDQIQGVDHTVYKVRIKNSDAKRGKSSGYRVIYYMLLAPDQTCGYLPLFSLIKKRAKSPVQR